MKVFMTGGAGFIGTHLCKKLLTQNYDITVYDNFSNSFQGNFTSVIKNKVTIISGNILDYSKLVSNMKNHDVVIHLAAKTSISDSIKNPKSTFDTNVQGTLNVLNSCLKNNVTKIIATSTAAVYQNVSTKTIFDETSSTVPSSPYGTSKLETEEKWKDYIALEKILNAWSIDTFDPKLGIEPHLRYFLLSSSMILFENYKVIPFLASITLLITTYLITKTITKNRFAGLVSMVLVLQSNLFLSFDTSITYSNFWILFYLLSLYLVTRIWFISPILFGASIFCKVLTAAFAPMSIFFILNSDIPKNNKIIIVAVLVTLLIAGGIMYTGVESDVGEEFRWDEFWTGFTSFAFQMRFDVITVLFLLPLIFGLFVISKNNKHANSISILITGILLTAPLLTGITEQTNQPYRFIPIIVFFAVGVGMLFSIKRV